MNGIEYLQFKKLLEYPGIKHLYAIGTNLDYRITKADKSPLSEEKYKEMIENHKNLCHNIGESFTKMVIANQTHSDNVEKIEKKNLSEKDETKIEERINTDALVTNKKDIILATTNADCILLFFYDPVKKVIANIHSGWKGTLQRISVKTLKTMEKEYGSKPEDILCCICPSIRKCHFEVEKEVKERFEQEFKEIKTDKIIEETIPNKKWHIDTIEINKIILQKEGIKEKNIIDSGICSVCNSQIIHSYRVEQEGYGVETAIIELKE